MTPSNGAVVLSVLAFLGTLALLVGLACLIVWGVVRRKPELARQAATGAAALLIVYAAALIVAGLASRDRVLVPGAEKYFCELDCHLAYAVTAVRQVGPPPAGAWAVSLRTRFDEHTISARRSREQPLAPNPRQAVLRTREGTRYQARSATGDELRGLGLASTPISQPLRPGEAYTTVLLFELPVAVAPESLELVESAFPTMLLIGHEHSPWHGRTLLALPGAS